MFPKKATEFDLVMKKWEVFIIKSNSYTIHVPFK